MTKEKEKRDSYNIDLVDILTIIIRYAKLLVLVFVVTAVLAFVASKLFMKEYYKTSVIMYPTANTSISGSLLGSEHIKSKSVLEYGDKEETEQMMQLLTSDVLAMRAEKHFKLMSHYGLTKDGDGYRTYFLLHFHKLVDIKRTDYTAIEIKVKDTDPQMAKDLANYLAFEVNEMKNAITKERSAKAFEIVKQAYNEKRLEIDSMNRIFDKLRSLGLYDYWRQSADITSTVMTSNAQYAKEVAIYETYLKNKEIMPDTAIIRAKARAEGAKASLSYLKPLIEKVKLNGSSWVIVTRDIDLAQRQLAQLAIQFANAKVDYESNIPQSFLVDPAERPEIPSEPRSKIIAAIAGVVAVILTLAYLIFIQSILPGLRVQIAKR